MTDAIDPERAARAATAAAALEGHEPTDTERTLYDQYIDGTIDVAELARALAKEDLAD